MISWSLRAGEKGQRLEGDGWVRRVSSLVLVTVERTVVKRVKVDMSSVKSEGEGEVSSTQRGERVED